MPLNHNRCCLKHRRRAALPLA